MSFCQLTIQSILAKIFQELRRLVINLARSKKLKNKSLKPVRDAEATQAMILSAAEEEFAQHGFTAARTEAIAAKTGVSKSMMYYYFTDKEGLYRAVLQQSHAELLKAVQQLELEHLSPEVALEKFLEALLERVSDNPRLPTLMFHEAVQNNGKFYQGSSSVTIDTALVTILEQGVAAGVFRPLDPFQSAINIMGSCLFYFIGAGNIQQFPQGKGLLSKAMLKKHTQEVITFVLAGVRDNQSAN